MHYRVTILQHRIPHYRVEFFEKLRLSLAHDDIELRIVCGQASKSESIRNDEGALSWANKVRNRYWSIRGIDMCWQPFPSELNNSDLIILTQENRILSNYRLIIKHVFSSTTIAYWGHGANLQSIVPNGMRERWKRYLLTKVDWWFAYTDRTVDIIISAGFPENNVTCLNNAIDTSEFSRQINHITDDDLSKVKKSLSLSDSSKIGLFCGSLYPEKKLDLLVAAADIIHQSIPEFRLIVVGDGPCRSYLEEAFESRDWANCVGVKREQDKAAFFRLASVILNPGAVGLHVLDAFAAGLPMVSTSNSLHGPEIVYLQDGKNGCLTEDNPQDYAKVVTSLFEDASLYEQISKQAKFAALEYTLDNMVERFSTGIKCALGHADK